MPLTFLSRALANPRVVGACLPSSSALAEALANAIPKGAPVIELGAGTGAVTQKLVDARHTLRGVVECDCVMARKLARKFPQIPVEIQDVERYLAFAPVCEGTYLVSSLPFKAFSKHAVERLQGAIERYLLLADNAHLLQYTYSLVSPPFVASTGLQWKKVKQVYGNIPPAAVWKLSKKP